MKKEINIAKKGKELLFAIRLKSYQITNIYTSLDLAIKRTSTSK